MILSQNFKLTYVMTLGCLHWFVVCLFLFFFGGEGRGRKKPHPNSSHFNLFDRGER